MTKSDLYVPRTYRHKIKDKDLVSFIVTEKETDLYIRATVDLHTKALRLVKKYREQLERYIGCNPAFLKALEPVAIDRSAPIIVKTMVEASAKVGVGPMAAVAGAIADFVGKDLSVYTPEIIIENGGDIYLKSIRNRVIGIYAGSSPLTDKIRLEIHGKDTPLGVCTSSGTVGHSLSFGKADAAIVVAKSSTIADAAATAVGNIIQGPDDIEKGLAFAQSIKEIEGTLIIIGSKIGIWGNVKVST